ncbi:MAG: hypothetical protein MJ087_01170 [Lachnospiraceae bacterium]|nr:hypothetical protein [Lachnospiraceae bacterium]
MIQYKCPCCGAALVFSPKTQKLSCDSCGNEYELETMEQYHATENGEDEPDLNWGETEGPVAEKKADGLYICPSCGGEVEADDNTVSTKCPYCDNVVIINPVDIGGFVEPDLIIPFSVGSEKAKSMLESFCKGKKLLPKDFHNKSYLKNLKGYYVPYWLFDCEADANMTFDATTIRSWSDSNYNYTETSFYRVERSGTMAFSNVPVDGSVEIDNSITESIEPFDVSKAQKFKTTYLSGYETSQYDLPSEEAHKRAKTRLYRTAESSIRNTVNGYHTVTTINRRLYASSPKVKYALFPIWLFETVYVGKKYQFAINGQTGKMVGELPVDESLAKSYMLKYSVIGTVILSILTLIIGGIF